MPVETPLETHSHVFLGAAHARNERNVYAVIALTSAMMLAEIFGGAMFGSIALVADGFHMSTHAGALLIAALAYTLARRHAENPAFTFGSGKFGDLAGFSSALILAMIALAIGYESAARLVAPRPINFSAAIPIAALGLVVNVVSAWLLSRGGHDHHHGHGREHAHSHHDHDHEHSREEAHRLEIAAAPYELSIFEVGTPPRFRLAALGDQSLAAEFTSVETLRPDGVKRTFVMADRGDYLESIDEIPEPHEFAATVHIGGFSSVSRFREHGRGHVEGALHRDHNMRAAVLHVIADAAVSVLVIAGLTLAQLFGWLWMDPLAGLVGAAVIASWSYSLIRDTARVLLDMNPDARLTEAVRRAIAREGDELADLHLWRLGPGHLGAIVSIATSGDRDVRHYRHLIGHVGEFSHLTVEILRNPVALDRERRHVA